MAAARRVPLERPPTATDETKVQRQQYLLRVLLGQNIKKFREEVGLSQRALAMRADLSTNHIGRCEKGRHAVTTDFLVRTLVSSRYDPHRPAIGISQRPRRKILLDARQSVHFNVVPLIGQYQCEG